MDIDQYIAAHTSAEPPYLQQLYRDTQVNLLYPHMASGHVQGRMLKLFVQMIRPRQVLEIGTYSGYSALCLAEGLDEVAELHTIEKNDEIEDFTRRWFDGSPLGSRIHFHIGDALQIVPALAQTFDLVFIDGNKRQYVDYYRLVLPRLREGGFIIADNTLWGGHILEADHRDAQTRGILAFNDLVVSDERVECVVLPLRDGLTIIRKKYGNNTTE